jgi:predicted dehydrogenase
MSMKRPENHSCVEDGWDLLIKQKSGCQISFHSSEANPRFTVLGNLEGTKGSLEWEWNLKSRIVYYKDSLTRSAGEEIPVYETIPDGLEEFIERYQAGKPPMVSLEDGLWSVLPPIFARKSVASGRIMPFPETLSALEKEI